MLVPITQSGTKPPFFLVHGLNGLLLHTAAMARALGPDRAFYAIFARGLDGRQQPCESVREMAVDYLQEIRGVQPTGPYYIGGQCPGGLVALEIARELSALGQQVGTVLLLNPPPLLPFGGDRYQMIDLHPQVFQQLYDNAQTMLRKSVARIDNVPFNTRDPKQMHMAAAAVVRSTIAFSRHRPAPYSGATDIILSTAQAPAHFQPELPWQQILTGPQRVHVLPGNHLEFFSLQLGEICRLMRFILDGALASETYASGANDKNVAHVTRHKDESFHDQGVV